MTLRRLVPADEGVSGKVTLPKALLALDDLLDDAGTVEGHAVHVDRLGRGRYRVVVLEEDNEHLRRLTPVDRGMSGRVTIPKDMLALDGLVDGAGAVQNYPIHVERLDRRTYEVVVLDDDLQPLDGDADDI